MDKAEEKRSTRVVRLLQNTIYPTYQLCAQMTSKKTKPQDGLRLAALTTMQWLRRRLEEAAPKEWGFLPPPEQYMEAPDDCLASFHISRGFLIDIVSLPDQGIWSLHITEPDLGPDPGALDQARPAVPGRIIETNVAFRIIGQTLYCGFQTVISDPVGTAQEAEVYRLAIIRQLANHPAFGLKQIAPLVSTAVPLSSNDEWKNYLALWKNEQNQLPCVLFSHAKAPAPAVVALESIPKISDLPTFGVLGFSGLSKPPAPSSNPAPAGELDYDPDEFARHMQGFCRTYVIKEALLEKLSTQIHVKVTPGDIVVMEPPRFGGQCQVINFQTSAPCRDETVQALRAELSNYPKGREISFGPISFLSAAREELLSKTRDAIHQAKESSVEWQQKIEQLEAHWKAELREKDAECEQLQERLQKQELVKMQLEASKNVLLEGKDQEIARLMGVLAEKDEQITFLRRKLSQPKTLRGISAWVKEHFPDRLTLLSCAEDMLADKSLQADPELICDSLDFLATDYWANRYERISKEEMKTRCSEKYRRPFEVKPIGEMTIKRYSREYTVKYTFSGQSRRQEVAMDSHLCVGNDAEKLIRIYFFHDDDRRLIVVGSLPRHLSAINC